MKTLLRIYLGSARNAEHNQFHADTLSVVSEEFANAKKMGHLRQVYADDFATEDEIFKHDTTFVLTADVEEFDQTRDLLYTIVRTGIDINVNHPVEARDKAAKTLAAVIRPYRDARALPYYENTAEIRNMVDELQDPANASALDDLKLTDDVELLRQTNEKFDEVWKKRSAEKLARKQTGNMREIRARVDNSYREFVDTLYALYMVNEQTEKNPQITAKFEAVIDGLNAVTLQLQQIISRRTSGGSSGGSSANATTE